MASEARKTLDELNVLKEEEKVPLSKDDTILFKNTFKTLWLVSKGTPNNKILKRIKENPYLRKELDDLETYFHLDPNKKEKAEEISKLYIVIDERNSDYELTDKGINAFSKLEGNTVNDFVMLDLGYEYGKIDSSNLSEKEKMNKKISLREEDSKRKEKAHNLKQLFRAHLLMEKDVDYIISNNEIIIIDENTGRAQPGRRFSDGLHQAIEAKENVKVQKETQTYATITLQNYFRMYEKLAGMSGTAITEAFEFKQIYKLDVLEIPTYTLCKRKDFDDEIYMTEREKYQAIVKEIKKQYEVKRPILIGTESVEISEKLSRILKQNKIPHNILNAKNHEREAEIIASAGHLGSITISTNMAGRGTDIKLTKEVKDVGGLYVLGTTRHQSRRIDRQLRGRSGRLGDIGSSKFYVSFEDSLMRLFASPRLTSMLQRFRPPEGEPISAKVLNKSIETAQKRIEQRNFQMRKHTLEYDDVMNLQRQEIYSFRNEIITSDNSIEIAKDILSNVIIDEISKYSDISLFNSKEFSSNLMLLFPVTIDYKLFEKENITFEEIEKIAIDKVLNTFDEKLNIQKNLILEINNNNSDEEINKVLNEVIRSIIIRKIDKNWQEHLLKIDHLRSDVSIRAYGQKDPLMEFKHEAFTLFDNLSLNLKLYISKDLFRFEMVSRQERKLNETIKELQTTTQKSFVPQPNQIDDNIHKENIEKTITSLPKVGRNDDCPCGSGKKHKKCCGLTIS
jgi:preprotein translocase subunit SecA